MFYNGTNFHLKSDNILGLEGRWTMEDGYGEEMDALETSLYPLRVLTAGSSVGLSLTLGVNEPDLDYLCRGQVQGFKVILHSPNELPDVKGQHFRVSVGEAVRMSIKPTVMVTTKSLEDYTPERRQCYFNAERKLNFMKAYTQRNCNLECIVNFTLAFCGCVPFFMPRNDSTPLCGELSVVCYLGVEDQLWEMTGLEYTLIKTCNCLPACTSIGYDAEISQSKFEIHKYQKALRLSTIPDELKMSQLLIFFKENEFIPSKRSEMIGMTDFVAACGGLLGLFMGISLLSIVELVYYFSLRLFCRYRLKNTKIVKKRMDVRVSKKRAPNFYW